ADLYLEYDAVHRVTKETQQGAGCSSCSDGLGTYTFDYATSNFPDGQGNWRRKSTITLPDSNQDIGYTNYAGEVLLSVYKETSSGNTWPTYFQYDTSGRLTLKALPSAVSGYDETRPDLLNNQSGNYQYLRDSSGLIGVIDYASSTTATST